MGYGNLMVDPLGVRCRTSDIVHRPNLHAVFVESGLLRRTEGLTTLKLTCTLVVGVECFANVHLTLMLADDWLSASRAHCHEI